MDDLNNFNETGFWKGTNHYEGIVESKPFKSGIKLFQVDAWRKLKSEFAALSESDTNDLISNFEGIDELF
jgi:hypothetical protein